MRRKTLTRRRNKEGTATTDHRQKSLRGKFVRFFTLNMVLVLLSTSAITLAISIRNLTGSSRVSLEQSALLGRAEVSAWFEEKELMLELIAGEMTLFDAGQHREMEDCLARDMERYPFLVDIYIGTPDNGMVSAVRWVGYDVRTRDWYLARTPAASPTPKPTSTT